MGREQRTTSGTSGAKSIVQPSFQLVGAEGTNKWKIADALARDHFTEKLGVISDKQVTHYPLGLMADYRSEILMASTRAVRLHPHDRATIYTHSLIDSLAYSLVRVDGQQTNGTSTPDQRGAWGLTMATIGCMLRDTFKADEIFFLMADFDSDTHYDQAKIQETQGFILDGFEMNYHIIDADSEGAVDDIAAVIRNYISA